MGSTSPGTNLSLRNTKICFVSGYKLEIYRYVLVISCLVLALPSSGSDCMECVKILLLLIKMILYPLCFRLKLKTGHCYKLSEVARNTLHELYVLMYMGMDYSIIREKRLELILLHDKVKKETYPIDKNMVVDNASVVFNSRDEFYRYVFKLMLDMGSTRQVVMESFER